MEKDIGKIKKNDNTDIVIRIDDFGGKIGLTIREFTTSDTYTGFTKSGTRIQASDFEEFKSMINSIDLSNVKLENKPTNAQPSKIPEKKPANNDDIPDEDLI